MLQARAQRQERREDRQGLEVRGQGSEGDGPECQLDLLCQYLGQAESVTDRVGVFIWAGRGRGENP